MICFEVAQAEAGMKLGAFLRGRGVSLAAVRSMKFIADGLRVNGRRSRTCDVLDRGDRVWLTPPEEPDFSAMPEQLPLQIVFENSDAMVLDKPAGQLVHPDRTHRSGTLANAWCGLMERRLADAGQEGQADGALAGTQWGAGAGSAVLSHPVHNPVLPFENPREALGTGGFIPTVAQAEPTMAPAVDYGFNLEPAAEAGVDGRVDRCFCLDEVVCSGGEFHQNGFFRSDRVFRQGRVFRPVGRLDADTSGLVLCAQNAPVAELLAKTAEKAYLALVGGRMPLGDGVVDAPLGPMAGSAIMQQVAMGGRPSRTEYRVLAAKDEASLVWVRPRTGRTHQIRVHMASIGHALLGDSLYGGETRYLPRHALHCVGLRFCGFAGRVALRLALPEDMAATARMLDLEPEMDWDRRWTGTGCGR